MVDVKLLHKLLVALPFSVIFYAFIFKIFKYLFRLINDRKNSPHQEESYFKNDLLWACVLYFLSTALFFYPNLRNISNALIGPPEDNMIFFWDIWFAQKVVLQHNASFFFSNINYYPQGVSLVYHPFSFYNLFLALPLASFFNPVFVYNLLILMTFFLAGIGGFILVRYFTKNSYASLIGGFIFAFNPTHFAHACHHMEIASIQFIPFFVLFFIKSIRDGTKRDLFLATLFFFLNGACSWYHFIFSIYFIALSYFYLAYSRKQLFMKEVLLKISIIIASSLVIFSPWILKLILEGLANPEIARHGGHNSFVADFLGFFVPHPFHFLARFKIIQVINNVFTGNDWEKSVYLGIVNILIVFFSFKAIKLNSGKFFLGFIAFCIFSMGQFLHIAGKTTPVILPFALISQVPFLSATRVASRFMVYGYLFWAVIVAYSLKYLFEAHKRSTNRNIVAVVFGLLIFLDFYSISTSLTPCYMPSCYASIPRENKIFGILDLPIGAREGNRYMMYQTFHGFPLVASEIDRRKRDKLIDELDFDDLDVQKKQLRENNVKYIVIHKKLVTQSNNINLLSYENLYEDIYADKENMVLRVY